MRTILATAAALGLVLLTTLCAGHLLDRRAQAHADRLLHARLGSLELEARRWQPRTDDSFADADIRREAQRTLQLLQDLYAQEQQLWTYYDALDRSQDTREAYLQDRLAYQERLQRHERALRNLQAEIDQLRPPADPGGISFTDTNQ